MPDPHGALRLRARSGPALPSVKDSIAQLLGAALRSLAGQIVPAEAIPAQLPIEHTRETAHGDFATNIAMLLAKPARRSPREFSAMRKAFAPSLRVGYLLTRLVTVTGHPASTGWHER